MKTALIAFVLVCAALGPEAWKLIPAVREIAVVAIHIAELLVGSIAIGLAVGDLLRRRFK